MIVRQSYDVATINRENALLGDEREWQTETGNLRAETANQANIFHQEGEYWTVTYHGRTARLRDSKGLSCIARLLAEPRCGVHVRDLAKWHEHSNASDSWGPLPVEGNLGAILDARATAQYKAQLAEARQELEEATAAGDLGQAARLRHEVEVITEQLAAA